VVKMDFHEIENDLQEVFEEMGDTENIFVRQYIPTDIEGVYRENKFKEYGEPIHLVGRVKLNPIGEEITEIGRDRKVNSIFTFTAKELRDKGLFTDRLLVTENDIIVYRSKEYSIVTITPLALFGSTFVLYKFEGKDLDGDF
jgi:hypothetical protein